MNEDKNDQQESRVEDVVARFEANIRELTERRAILMAQVAEIDAVFDKLRSKLGGANGVSPARRPAAVPRLGSSQTVPELVRSVLAQHPKGMSSLDVFEAVHAIKRNATKRDVHTALRKASKTGTPRSYIFFPRDDWRQ